MQRRAGMLHATHQLIMSASVTGDVPRSLLATVGLLIPSRFASFSWLSPAFALAISSAFATCKSYSFMIASFLPIRHDIAYRFLSISYDITIM